MMKNDPTHTAIGQQALPQPIRQSTILSAAQIAQLAGVTLLPVIDPSYHDERLQHIFQYYSINPEELETELHLYAKELLDGGKIDAAWQVLLSVS